MSNPPASPTVTSHRDLTLALYGALLAGQLDVVRRHAHEDVVLHVPGTHPLAGDHRGPDALVRFVESSRRRTADGERIEVLDVLEGTDHAAAYLHVSAEREGRAPLSNLTVHLLRLVDGRVAEVWLHNWDGAAVDEFWS